MTPAALFSFGNSFVLIGWVLLLVVPNWKYSQTIILKGVILIIAIIYTILLVEGLGSFNPESFSTLEGVKALFKDDAGLVAAWFHYLAFDLFVGAYVVKESEKIGLSRWVYSLILPFTFMFGPVGYLLFIIVKSVKTKTIIEE